MTLTHVIRAVVPLLLWILTGATAALAAGADPASADPWTWPVGTAASPPVVVRPFAPPGQPWLAGHRGADLAADAGTTVRSAGAGVVSYAGGLAGRGVVAVVHGDLRTTYEPVTATVSVGQRVAVGEPLGRLEPRGHCVPAACLHWGLRRGDVYLDPLSLLSGGPARLLPLGDAALPATTGPGPTRPGGDGTTATGAAGSAVETAADEAAGATRSGRRSTVLAAGAALGLAASAATVAAHGRRAP
jgi:hypothetical protein